MKAHRLDYGSFTADWQEPRSNPGIGCFVVCARCICGAMIGAEGPTFTQTNDLLLRHFARHLTEVEDNQRQPIGM
jgi:hypothetical protein